MLLVLKVKGLKNLNLKDMEAGKKSKDRRCYSRYVF